MKTEELNNSIQEHPKFYTVLGLSVLFFLWKGVHYAFIGSFIPLVVILSFLVLLYWSQSKSDELYKRSLKFWAIVLIIWSGFRLLLTVVDAFIEPMNESHIHEQLGFFGLALSLLFLVTGFYLFVKSKYLNKKSHTS